MRHRSETQTTCSTMEKWAWLIYRGYEKKKFSKAIV